MENCGFYYCFNIRPVIFRKTSLGYNAKMGAPENTLFDGSPALEVGVFNVRTQAGITDQAIAYFVTGRNLPTGLGWIHLSVYAGNGKVIVSSLGEKRTKACSGLQTSEIRHAFRTRQLSPSSLL